MHVVVALGGNALLRRGEALTADNQRKNVKVAAASIADLLRDGHHVTITHGNGPQVGLLALQSLNNPDISPYPLDVLSAETVGMIGYWLEQEIANACGTGRNVATVLTRIQVNPADPAFGRPTKPVGPSYSGPEADTLVRKQHWSMALDEQKYRRVVASPMPHKILEIDVLRLLVRNGVIVICTGAGGIPVVQNPDGSYEGIEAVIDKDHASALLAKSLRADALLLLTDVRGVYQNWGTSQEALVSRLKASDFNTAALPVGSMGPKVTAALSFAQTGRVAAIGRLDEARAILRGQAGTTIVKS